MAQFKQEINCVRQLIRQAKNDAQNSNRKSDRKRLHQTVNMFIMLYKNMIIDKVDGPMQNDRKLLLSKIQKVLDEEINDDCKQFKDLNIKMWYPINILVQKNKWADDVSKMDLKEVMEKIKQESIEGKFNIFIWRWWGLVWDSSKNNEISRSDINNPKTKEKNMHSRLCMAIKIGKLVIWLGYDPSGYRPGVTAFFKSFIKKTDKPKRIQKDLRLLTLHDNYSYVPMVTEKYFHLFNVSFKYKPEDEKEDEKYCCDEASIICGWIFIINCIEKWTELQTIKQRLYEIKRDYTGTNFWKDKKLLNKEIKMPIRDVIIPPCQKITERIVKDFINKSPHAYDEIKEEYKIRQNYNNKNKKKRKIQFNDDNKSKKRHKR